MSPNKTLTELPADEVPWRHAWLTKSQIGNPNPDPISHTRTVARMSLARRLEKLHRLRAALEPPRSWLDKK